MCDKNIQSNHDEPCENMKKIMIECNNCKKTKAKSSTETNKKIMLSDSDVISIRENFNNETQHIFCAKEQLTRKIHKQKQ